MEDSVEIQGVEFDWFALDQTGHFALFATAGSAPVPVDVLISAAAHSAISDAIIVSGFG